MKRKSISFYYIIFVVFLQVFICLQPVMAISEGQRNAIVTHCDTIRESLKMVQKQDARARVYLGGYYETMISKYIVSLNVRLVENSLSDTKLIENQNSFTADRAVFTEDYVDYQQSLEELVLMDCKTESEGFYKGLENVRKEREKVRQDVLKLESDMNRHIELVNRVKGRI